MDVMSVMPREVYDWTVDDLEQLPADGLQYELIDGVLLVSPAPVVGHQRVARALFMALQTACPEDCEVFFAPVDFQPDRRTSVQPDLLVVRRGEIGIKNLTVPFLLAVEILSPSTRRKDLVLKHAVYADAGVASYWTLDPEKPAVTCWDLAADGYAEAGRARGDEAITLQRPYPVTLVPSALLG